MATRRFGPGLSESKAGADLRLVDAELGRQRVVEALEPVAATLAADDLAVAVELLERGRDLGLVEAERGRQRLGELVLVTSSLAAAAVGTQVLERGAQLGLGDAELGGDAGEVAGAAGAPGAGAPALAGVGLPPASAVPSPVWVPSA